MATISSGTDLSSTFYLRNFYTNNKNLVKSSNRKNYLDIELSYEDSRALSRAAKALSKFSYSESDNSKSITNSVLAFTKTFNYTLESTKDTTDSSSKRYVKQLKKLTSKYKDELEDLGITINGDGSLKVNEDFLKNRDSDELGKLFNKNSDFSKQLKQLSKKLSNSTYSDIYSQMTGSGLQVNITL